MEPRAGILKVEKLAYCSPFIYILAVNCLRSVKHVGISISEPLLQLFEKQNGRQLKKSDFSKNSSGSHFFLSKGAETDVSGEKE